MITLKMLIGTAAYHSLLALSSELVRRRTTHHVGVNRMGLYLAKSSSVGITYFKSYI